MGSYNSAKPGRDDCLIDLAMKMIAARSALGGLLPAAYLVDTALDVLLNLYVDGPTTAQELMLRTTSPPQVAKRWIASLANEGVIFETATEWSLSADGQARVEAALTRIIGNRRTVRLV